MSVRHALLALLAEGPKYGLQLRHEFEERTGEVWPLNVGQVYTTLQRLERDGLVESDGEGEVGPQKSFRLTADGGAELDAWLLTPPDLSSPPRDELVIKVLVASRVPGVEVHDVIQTHRRHIVELMQEWTRVKRDAGPDEVNLALVVEAELFRLDSVIRWLDAADARLRRAGLARTPIDPSPVSARDPDSGPDPRGGRTPMSALQLTEVSKVYGSGVGEIQALRGVDLTVEPGELVAIMGPSGSGKSTLLTIAGSLEEPSAGEVIVGGVPLSRLSRGERAALRRRAIGYVFQDFNLLAGLTAAENVSLPLELDGTSAKAARAAALAVLNRLGLGERADRFPDDLSGGERQRVAIARAVVGERHLVLADEPSGALDSANGEAVMRLVRETCQGGVAGVVVTHDAQLASWADRVIFLRDGQIIDHTTPAKGPESLLGADPAR